jgi:hypothetical protein
MFPCLELGLLRVQLLALLWLLFLLQHRIRRRRVDERRRVAGNWVQEESRFGGHELSRTQPKFHPVASRRE